MLETVRTSQNQTQTCDLLVRPDFMYQTNMRKSLVHGFGIVFWYRLVRPRRGHGVGMGRSGWKSPRQGQRGAHVGRKRRHPIKAPHGAEA